MSNSNRERDLVLAPNEYAFISDQTKGNVIAYVGPYKTSMANTDKPVFFNRRNKRFDICSLEDSIQTFATAPEGWYVILKNPSVDGNQPKEGTSNNLPNLEIGRKVNLPGPRFFALWPGQMASIVEGHHLRSNEYLLVRVYEEEQARANWNKAVITPQKTNPENLEEEPEDGSEQPSIMPEETPNLTMGQLLIIKGTNVSFYIPPTGVEVVKNKDGQFVRKAVTLERLEYCILLDEDGNKRYIKGPAVVFPKPTEQFITRDGLRKFKAIELNELSGIYVKVIAPYTEADGTERKVGEELFITGKDQMIYFPRTEHALVRYGDREIYHAVAIPHGQGRYVLNRTTGNINLKEGPSMLLPDPREEVIVRRILSPKQVKLWFPGNEEALAYNLRLQEIAEKDKKRKKEAKGGSSQQQYVEAQKVMKEVSEEIASDSFERSDTMKKPRTIVLDDKYDGAVTIDVWTGYAIQVVSKTGNRKVIVGPKTYQLNYDESLQPISLSTGTPKVDEDLLRTVYLRAKHNKVSDRILAETKDFCDVGITVSYRVNFEGEAEQWFNVENYVKFLTDHLRSVVRNALKRYTIADFYDNSIQILRDTILGQREEEKSKRPGWTFAENGMHIYDVEVLEIDILDADIEALLFESKHDEVRQNIALAKQARELRFIREQEQAEQEKAELRNITKLKSSDLEKAEVKKRLELRLEKLQSDLQAQEEALKLRLAEQQRLAEINAVELSSKRAQEELQLELAQKALEQHLLEIRAEVEAVVSKAEAVSPELIAALQAFGDKALAEKMADSMAPLSIIGGKSLVEVFGNLLKGTQLEEVLRLKAKEEE